MAYVRIAVDTVQPGRADELVARIRSGLLPLLQRQPGFVAYEVVVTKENTAVFVHTCSTQAQAEAAIQNMAPWVRENVTNRIVSADKHFVGELAITSREVHRQGEMRGRRFF